MISRYNDGFVTSYQGDCRDMSEIPDESVQCVVTSPPYWGLRKYAGDQELVWEGDNHCEHQWKSMIRPPQDMDYSFWKTGGIKRNIGTQEAIKTDTCSLCGAWRGAYGLEPTPEMYVQHTVEILREIRRVLRKDGVVFWNIGDSYGSGKCTCFNPGGGKGSFSGHGDRKDAGAYPLDRGNVSMLKASGLKPKDLCLIPSRVALAAQADGWWVRCDVIWNKPNPMPESVTDRPTISHEYIWILTKSGTPQYWTHRDHAGTRQRPKADWRWVNEMTEEEVAVEPPDWREKVVCPECSGETNLEVDIGLGIIRWEECDYCHGKGKVKLWKRVNLWRGHDYYWDADAVREAYTEPMNRWGGESLKRDTSKKAEYKDMLNIGYSSAFRVGRPMRPNEAGRNIRSVWEFPTKPYPETHFAVFPDELPTKCIMSATPPKCCAECGAAWARIVEKKPSTMNIRVRDAKRGVATAEEGYKASSEEIANYGNEKMGYTKTLGWQPTCNCNAGTEPSIVLDPLAGSGTVGKVAKELGRKAILIDISGEYCELARKRVEAVPAPMPMAL